jgi:type II protein arginine methyltransferase
MSGEGEAFSNIDLVAQCMADEARSAAFDRALREVVKPGMRVLDVGTGSGLLAMMAARAGAKSVLAVELDPLVAAAARRNIEENQLQHIVSVVERDAADWSLPRNERPYDVVVMELLTTGMIDEAQVAASNNLHRNKLVGHETIFVPNRIDTHVELGTMNYSVCGFEMKMVRHLWDGFPDRNHCVPLTRKGLLRREDFNGIIQTTVDEIVTLTAAEAGLVNCVCFSSETFLSPSVSVWDSLAMNAPVVVPIDPFQVKENAVIKLRVRYEYGSGFGQLKLSIVSVQSGLKYAV